MMTIAVRIFCVPEGMASWHSFGMKMNSLRPTELSSSNGDTDLVLDRILMTTDNLEIKLARIFDCSPNH